MFCSESPKFLTLLVSATHSHSETSLRQKIGSTDDSNPDVFASNAALKVVVPGLFNALAFMDAPLNDP